MERFIDRLQVFMESEGINDNQLTVNAGLSVGLIGKCRKKGSGMLSDNIEKILLAYPSLSADWLLTGRGEMLVEKTQHSDNGQGHASLEVSVVQSAGAVIISDAASLESIVKKIVTNVLGER